MSRSDEYPLSVVKKSSSDLSLLFELFVVSQRAGAVLREVMEDSPITSLEYAMYSLVFDMGAASPTEMAKRLGMPVTTVLDHVREMERRGHISREANPSDGRSYLMSLTPSGLAVHRAAGEHFNRGMSRILQHLDVPENDVRVALEALGRATDAAIADLSARIATEIN